MSSPLLSEKRHALLVCPDQFTLITRAHAQDLIDSLRQLGIDSEVSLPQIAVVGATSSGKSSLLSMISGIKLPSGSELTTRCPIELILRQSTHDFEARVTLRNHADVLNSTPTTDFPLRSPSALEVAIAAAQQGMVSWRSVCVFLRALRTQVASLDDARQRFSSSSIIVVEVRSRTMADLTLIDLPGTVSDVGEGEDKSVKLDVENMIKRYIDQERTVILVVHPATVDYHNSLLAMAEEFDAPGERTLCVVTKPDMVAAEDRASVVALVKNQVRLLTLGFHCVRGRPTKEIADDIGASLAKEKQFFASVQWDRDTSLAPLCGIEALIPRLSDLLMERTEQQLPSVRQEVARRLERCSGELQKLGGDLSLASVRRGLFSETSTACVAVLKNAVDTCQYAAAFFNEQTNRVVAVQRELECAFSKRILELAHVPCEGELVVGDTVLHRRSMNGAPLQLDEQKMRGKFTYDLVPATIDDFVPVGRKSLLQELARCRGRELPGFPSYAVFVKLVTTRINDGWVAPAHELLTAASHNVCQMLTRLVERDSVPVQLRAELRAHALAVSAELYERARQQLATEIRKECSIVTQNDYYTQTMEKLRMAPLVAAVKRQANDAGQLSVAQVEALLKDVLSMSNEQNEAREMEYRLHAYLRVAAKRFVDSVIAIVHTTLFTPLAAAVERRWASTMAGDDELQRLFAETAVRKATRARLVEQERRLLAANARLTN
jgi:GTP-binding protein EngB required for normal cell division